MSTRARIRERARAHEHEHESSRARAPKHSPTLEHEVHSSTSTSTRCPCNECEPSGERHAIPVGRFFNHVGMHAPGWLYVLEMPPRGYLPVLATLNPQSTCHGPRPGPTLAPWCTGGLLACPGAENTRKDPRPDEKKMPMCIKTRLYMVRRTVYIHHYS